LTAVQRRELIEDAAMEVFAERGYHGASMGQIAATAGITAAVIYDHFDAKAALHNALLERKMGELLAYIASALDRAPSELAPRARAGIGAFYEFVEREPFAWRFLFRDPPADPLAAEAQVRVQRRATEAIAVFVRDGAPDVFTGDPERERGAEVFAQLLKTAQDGLAAWWYEHPDVPRGYVVDRAVEFCWTGMERVIERERSGAR
jgi:AcrR family transcriptional regulator